MGIELRPNQAEAKQAIYDRMAEGLKRILLVADTGWGKTELTLSIVQDVLQEGRKVCFFAHRDLLLRNVVNRCNKYGLPYQLVNGKVNQSKVDPTYPFTIVSALTLQSRKNLLDWMLEDIVFFDEAHESCWISHVKDNWGKPRLTIGLTATPWRLKKTESMADLFEVMVPTKLPRELIEMGLRVPFKYFYNPSLPLDKLKRSSRSLSGFDEKSVSLVVDNPESIKAAIDNWVRIGENRETLCFAANIAHSKNVCAAFNERGIPAAHIDKDTKDDERNSIIKALEARQIKVICSCDTLSSGVDIPIVSCILNLAPTLSRAKNYQREGRGSRNYSGKTDCLILDMVGNVTRYDRGRVQDLIWEDYALRPATKKQSTGDAPIKICPSCGYINHASVKHCENCDFEFPEAPKIIVKGDLALYDRSKPKNWMKPEDTDMQLFQETKRKAFALNQAPGYAAVQFKKTRGFYPAHEWELGAVFQGNCEVPQLKRYYSYLKACTSKKPWLLEAKKDYIRREMIKEFGATIALDFLNSNDRKELELDGLWQTVIEGLPKRPKSVLSMGAKLERIDGNTAIVRSKVGAFTLDIQKNAPVLAAAFTKVMQKRITVQVVEKV